jgi:hypothetical protein
MAAKKETELKNVDYVHSSNAIFNFMKESKHLKDALLHKRLSPRYCEENIEYLQLKNEDEPIQKIGVLQKCFCDIPLHNIKKGFVLTVIDDVSTLNKDIIKELEKKNTHTDFYGEYGIAFSKNWTQIWNLQPVQYINMDSAFAYQFKKMFEYVADNDDSDDIVDSDIISRLSYYKPLYGEMTRTILDKRIRVNKNFFDECEWRYVPKEEVLEKYHISSVIFDEETLRLGKNISDRLEQEEYKELWLSFDYEDIAYLIVPNKAERNNLIEFIMNLKNDSEKEKLILVSKILVLEDIKKDF